jgi:hypothetical protein
MTFLIAASSHSRSFSAIPLPVNPTVLPPAEFLQLSFTITYLSINVQNASCITEQRPLIFSDVFGTGPGQVNPEDFLDAVYRDLVALGYPGLRSSIALTELREESRREGSRRSRRNTCSRCGADVNGDMQVPSSAAGIASTSISGYGSTRYDLSGFDSRLNARAVKSGCSASTTFLGESVVVEGESV